MWKIQVLLCGTFWNFFPDVFDLWLVERADAGPVDMEGQLYTKRKVCFFWGLISTGTLDSEVLGITRAEGWVFTHCGGGFPSAGSRALFCAVLRGARAGTDGVGCSPEWIKAGKGGSEALGKRTGGQVWGVRWCHSWPFPPEDGIWVGTKESYFGVTLQEPREVQSGVWDRRSFLDETWLWPMMSDSWSPKKKVELRDQRPGLPTQGSCVVEVLLQWNRAQKVSDKEGGGECPPC